jgi:predicted enzyme related to lactoylglutathione lyase
MRIIQGGHISYLFILVHDLDRTLFFYRDTLGFDVTHAVEGHCAFLALPGTRVPQIALYAGRKTLTSVDTNHWFVVIDVDDLDAAAARVVAKGVPTQGVFDVPYGRAMKITDPEGNVIQLHQLMSAHGRDMTDLRDP